MWHSNDPVGYRFGCNVAGATGFAFMSTNFPWDAPVLAPSVYALLAISHVTAWRRELHPQALRVHARNTRRPPSLRFCGRAPHATSPPRWPRRPGSQNGERGRKRTADSTAGGS